MHVVDCDKHLLTVPLAMVIHFWVITCTFYVQVSAVPRAVAGTAGVRTG